MEKVSNTIKKEKRKINEYENNNKINENPALTKYK